MLTDPVSDSTSKPGLGSVAVLALGITVLAAGCALVAHHSCTDPGPPVLRPEAGTPRAGYCAATDHAVPWSAALAALLVAAITLLIARRFGPRAVGATTVVLAGICLAHAILAGSPDFAMTT